jgi:cytochrome c-type biogenesis protein CcmH
MNVVVLVLVFGLVALIAAGFVVLPLLRAPNPSDRRPWLAVAAGIGVLAVGLGAYGMLGQPRVALSQLVSSLGTSNPTDYQALVATLARRMPDRPGDRDGWSLLGRGYMALGMPDQAAKSYQRAVAIAKTQDGAAPPELLTDYGEAITQASGQITPDAEAVFKEALKEDPRDFTSRLYLGLAAAERGDKAGALQLWEGLLADAPPDAPWRGQLVDRLAALKASTGGAAPNPMAMVAQLASRLETNPNDLDGWLRLIRAYTVLGDKEKAGAALTRARTVFANQAQAQDALALAAKDNALN